MKVKKLIAFLKNYNPDLEVILSRDEEGNGFNLLQNLEDNIVYDKEEHAIYLSELTDKLKAQGYSEDDLYTGKHGVPAIVLWP
jgi:hypothetical protein